MAESTPVDLRQMAGVLAGESRRRLWASIVLAQAVSEEGVAVDDLSSKEKRDLRALEQAGLVSVDGGRAVEVPDAFSGLLAEPKGAPSGPERFLVKGVLESLPRRAGDRREVLHHIATQVFPTADETLPEKELMERLHALASDPVGVRRELVDRGFVGRERDGSKYWLARSPQP